MRQKAQLSTLTPQLCCIMVTGAHKYAHFKKMGFAIKEHKINSVHIIKKKDLTIFLMFPFLSLLRIYLVRIITVVFIWY